MDLRANTAVDVLIGPFVDNTDGDTEEPALTLSQADIKLSKNGQTLAQKSDITAAAHDANGYYNCELDATDTNTEGNLVLIVHETGALPVRHEFNIMAEAAWDSLYVAKDDGFMDVNIKTIGRVDTQETEANNLESACSNYSVTRGLTGTSLPAAVADAAGGLVISDLGGVDMDQMAADTNDALVDTNELQTDWVNGGRLDLILDSIKLVTDSIVNSPTLVDAIWDEVLTGGTHNVVNSAGRRLRFIQEAGGYSGGAIYIDTVNGVAGTVDFENGVDSNPVDSITDANTLATSLGISTFHIAAGSTITLAAAQTNQVFKGENWTLALAGQNIAGSVFIGANVSGIASGSGTNQKFVKCLMNACSHIKSTHILECGIADTQTVIEAGDFFLDRCHSAIAGTSTWIFEFGDAIGNTNLNVREYSGGIQLESMGDTGTDTASIEGQGQIIEGTCTGGTVAVRGPFTISGITNLTLSDDARIDTFQINAECDVAISDAGLATHLTDIKGATFSGATDSLEAIRDRGDTAWITGGGGGITDILNLQPVIPTSIDLANTSTVRLGLMLTNGVDDLPSTAEITPGTIDIDRKAIGGTSWSNIVSGSACSEQAGMIFFDEVFDSGTGYAEGDSIRITFKSQKITVAANDYEITDANGVMFQTEIRQTMRGTDGANTTVPDAAGVAPTAVEVRQEIDSNSTQLASIVADTNELQTDWTNAGRLDTILDELTVQGDTNETALVAIKLITDLLTLAAINAEVVDVLKTDTIAERTNGAPTATPTFEEAISYLYMQLTNKIDADAGFKEFYNNAGTIIWKKALTDDSSNYVEANGQAGT